MKYDPNIHHRRSIRLQGFDYSSSGAYYVTLCTQNGECLLEPEHVREMVQSWWEELPKKFPAVFVDAFVIMPNHVHGIIFINDVGANLGVRPGQVGQTGGSGDIGQTHRSTPTLGDIIQWFKTMTTNAYIRGVKQLGWEPFPGKLWQRNYYEHIVRDQKELARIRRYIEDNPRRWEEDVNYPGRK